MKIYLSLISATMLIFSCNSSSNKETKPQYDSTIIGQWKCVQDGQVVEFTPTHYKGVWGEQTYVLKGDRLMTYYDDGTPSIEYKVWHTRTKMSLESLENVRGDMTFERYDPEEERKKAEAFEKGWNELAKKKKAERKENRGNERDGDIIDYCPRCFQDASKAYAVQNGILIEQPYFMKGGAFVCYSCAKELKAQSY